MDSPLYPKDNWDQGTTDQWMQFVALHPGRWIATLAFEKVVKKMFNMGGPNERNFVLRTQKHSKFRPFLKEVNPR